jgi:hypothetical protein
MGDSRRKEPAPCATHPLTISLIKAGQTYYLTIEQGVLCEDCALSEGVVPVREDLAVELKRDRLLV